MAPFPLPAQIILLLLCSAALLLAWSSSLGTALLVSAGTLLGHALSLHTGLLVGGLPDLLQMTALILLAALVASLRKASLRAGEEAARQLNRERMARQAAEASVEELHHALEEARLLARIVAQVAGEGDLELILQDTLQCLRGTLPLTTASIALIERNQLVPRAAIGPFAGMALNRSLPRGRGLAWQAIESGRARVATGPLSEGMQGDLSSRSYLALPLIWRGRALGVLEMSSTESDVFDAPHLRLLEQVAEVLAGPIQLAERYAAETRTALEARRAKQRFYELVQSLDAIVWESEPASYGYTFVSQRAEEMLGYPLDRWSAEPDFWLDLIHPEDYEQTVREYRDAMRHGVNHMLEYRALTADGRVLWLRDIIHILRDEQGSARQLRGLTLNMTEQKRVEQRLTSQGWVLEMIVRGRPLEEILQTLVQLIEESAEGTLCSILLLDESGKGLRSPIAPSLSARYREALYGVPIGPEIGSCDSAAYHRQIVIVSDIKKDSHRGPYRELLLQEGLRACWSAPICTAHNQLLGTFAMYRREAGSPTAQQLQLIEVARHIAGIALERQRSEEQQRLLTETSKLLATSLDFDTTLDAIAHLILPHLADWCAIYLLEADDAYRLASVHVGTPHASLLPALESLLEGVTYPALHRALEEGRSELIAKHSGALLSGEGNDPIEPGLAQELAPRSIMVVPLLTRNRVLGAITLACTAESYHYSQADLVLAEEIAHRAALALDNASLYRRAQEALQVRDIFFSVASHELKGPITTIKGYAQLLRRRGEREGKGRSHAQRSLSIIHDEATRLNQLVDLLLDLSRIKTGRLQLERAPLDIVALVRRLITVMQPTLESHELRLSAPDTMLMVDGDALRLEQVLYNLVQNAAKYSPSGEPIQIAIEPQARQVALSVTDRGIGIPSESLAQLFNRFYRAQNVSSSGIGGMGLGLYIVHHIIDAHGGTVHVSSELERGSTFTVELPLLRPPES